MRWRLLGWYTGLLVLVVCLFSITLYLYVREARLRSIDVDLRATGEVLAARLRPRRPLPGENRRVSSDETQRRMEVPEHLLYRFQPVDPARHKELSDAGASGREPLYFAIWLSSGEMHVTSQPLPGIPTPPPAVMEAGVPQPQFRQRGILRECTVRGPFGMRVLVGTSLAGYLAELRELAIVLGLAGSVVTVFGTLGAWLLSARALRPVRAIGAIAESISSASNLSRRIDQREMASELSCLANVLNEMFSRLESAFQRQVRFTADASHELRTPLSVIHSQAELALTRQRTAAEYRDALAACFRASRRMKGVVDSLLVLARSDSGKLEIRSVPFDLAAAVGDCVDLIRPLADERGVKLQADLRPATICGDPSQLELVVTNILTNSIIYNRKSGSVCVDLRPNGADVVLSVTDTGVGISAEDLGQVFERFFRVDKARSCAADGSGLGLAISKTIVEAHGGQITLTSRVNAGTTVVIQLPIGQDRA